MKFSKMVFVKRMKYVPK